MYYLKTDLNSLDCGSIFKKNLKVSSMNHMVKKMKNVENRQILSVQMYYPKLLSEKIKTKMIENQTLWINEAITKFLPDLDETYAESETVSTYISVNHRKMIDKIHATSHMSRAEIIRYCTYRKYIKEKHQFILKTEEENNIIYRKPIFGVKRVLLVVQMRLPTNLVIKFKTINRCKWIEEAIVEFIGDLDDEYVKITNGMCSNFTIGLPHKMQKSIERISEISKRSKAETVRYCIQCQNFDEKKMDALKQDILAPKVVKSGNYKKVVTAKGEIIELPL